MGGVDQGRGGGVKTDWGLLDSNAVENKLLREEIVYGYKVGVGVVHGWGDVKMDWGLLDSNAVENKLLREEIVYGYKVGVEVVDGGGCQDGLGPARLKRSRKQTAEGRDCLRV